MRPTRRSSPASCSSRARKYGRDTAGRVGSVESLARPSYGLGRIHIAPGARAGALCEAAPYGDPNRIRGGTHLCSSFGTESRRRPGKAPEIGDYCMLQPAIRKDTFGLDGRSRSHGDWNERTYHLQSMRLDATVREGPRSVYKVVGSGPGPIDLGRAGTRT